MQLDPDNDEAASIALEIIGIIKSHLIVDIWPNEVAQNDLRNAIDDYFFNILRYEKGVDLPVEVLDKLEGKIMDLARAGFAVRCGNGTACSVKGRDKSMRDGLTPPKVRS